VVTGGSDGIGLEMCRNLAKQGFNICIVSRNEAKINEKLHMLKDDLKGEFKSIETRCVVADFSKMTSM
jgi:short-subunit dehydrogenase